MGRGFHLSFRTPQHKGHPHPVLSRSTKGAPALITAGSPPTELEARLRLALNPYAMIPALHPFLMLQRRLKTITMLNNRKHMTTIKQTFLSIVVFLFLAAAAAMAQTNLPGTNSPSGTNWPGTNWSGTNGSGTNWASVYGWNWVTDPSLGPIIPGDDLVPIVVIPPQISATPIQMATPLVQPSIPPATSITPPATPSTATPSLNTSPPSSSQ